MNDSILYISEDGQAQVQLRACRGKVWLAHMKMAVLFNARKQNINREDELTPAATDKEFLAVQTEGACVVCRSVHGQELLVHNQKQWRPYHG